MTTPERPQVPGPSDDPEVLEESLLEARDLLEEVLDQVAEAAFVIGAPRGLLPTTADGDVEFDEADLVKTNHPTLIAIAKIAEAIYAALETLPEPPEDEEGDDEDGGEEE
ncbi:MAG: hypothetical protein U1F43_27155 [Myxococcota bacterium]